MGNGENLRKLKQTVYNLRDWFVNYGYPSPN